MNRRNFIKRGALFVPSIFVPRLIRAQAFTFRDQPWLANATPKAAGGGGNGLLTGLVSAWEMEAANNSNETDVKGGLTLTSHGTCTQDTINKIQGSASCNPTSAGYKDNSSASLNPASTFTVLFWVYPTGGLSGQYLLCNWDTAKGFLFFSLSNTTQMRFYTQLSGGSLIFAESGATTALNKWSLVIGGYDAPNNVNWISVNGENKVTTANTVGITASSKNFTVFNQPLGTAGNVTANFDETAYWNRALTQSDITTIINGYNFTTQVGSPLFFPSWS